MTKSFWTQSAKKWPTNDDNDDNAKFPSKSSVVVIGSGMSGVSVAYHLAKEGVDVIVLDSRNLCDGATGRNGGVIHPHSWRMLPLMWRSRKIWDAINLVRMELRGREAIRRFAREFDVKCDLTLNINAIELHRDVESSRRRVGNSMLFSFLGTDILSRLSGVHLLRNKNELKKEINVVDSSQWNAGIISLACCDTFWAHKFVRALATEAANHNAKFIFNTHVKEISKSDKDMLVVTSSGRTIRCDKVVVATNAWASCLLPELKDRIVPVRNHVLTTKPLSKHLSVSKRPIVFSARDGFVYGMQREDGRVILGGFRDMEKNYGVHQSDDSCLDNEVVNTMKQFLLDTFYDDDDVSSEEMPEIEQVWTGIIGWSFDDTPFVGEIRENVYVCAGFCGHGMCQTFLCGKAISEMIMNRVPEQFVASFRPDLEKRQVRTANYYAGHTVDLDGDGGHQDDTTAS